MQPVVVVALPRKEHGDMHLFGYSLWDYFNRWFVEPIPAADGDTVVSVMHALCRHLLAQDETAQDEILLPERYGTNPGRLHIYVENQGIWVCFVYERDARLPDPPVYFESDLDLQRDHGLADADILDGDHGLVCPNFRGFVWHMLGNNLCYRMETSGLYQPGVYGVVFKRNQPVVLDDTFVNPLGRPSPLGDTCFFAPEVICIPTWGAAFLNADSGRRFLDRYGPAVSRRWDA